jgi:hypothetical protein
MQLWARHQEPMCGLGFGLGLIVTEDDDRGSRGRAPCLSTGANFKLRLYLQAMALRPLRRLGRHFHTALSLSLDRLAIDQLSGSGIDQPCRGCGRAALRDRGRWHNSPAAILVWAAARKQAQDTDQSDIHGMRPPAAPTSVARYHRRATLRGDQEGHRCATMAASSMVRNSDRPDERIGLTKLHMLVRSLSRRKGRTNDAGYQLHPGLDGRSR